MIIEINLDLSALHAFRRPRLQASQPCCGQTCLTWQSKAFKDWDYPILDCELRISDLLIKNGSDFQFFIGKSIFRNMRALWNEKEQKSVSVQKAVSGFEPQGHCRLAGGHFYIMRLDVYHRCSGG